MKRCLQDLREDLLVHSASQVFLGFIPTLPVVPTIQLETFEVSHHEFLAVPCMSALDENSDPPQLLDRMTVIQDVVQWSSGDRSEVTYHHDLAGMIPYLEEEL